MEFPYNNVNNFFTINFTIIEIVNCEVWKYKNKVVGP